MKLPDSKPKINRRRFLRTAIVATSVPAAGAAISNTTSLSVLLEDVMAGVTPHAMRDYVTVRADALQRLCDSVGVEFANHWAKRGTV